LVVELGVLGHNVYFESKNRSGSSRWDDVFSSIEQSDAFIYTMTMTTQASYSRLLEYEHALALGKPIIPVRLQEIDLWALPPGIPPILDYNPHNEATRPALARRLSLLPPVPQPTPSIARPALSFALSQLRRRVDTPDKDPIESAAILMNLQEFLERRETHSAAEAILSEFLARTGDPDGFIGEGGELPVRLRRMDDAKPPFRLRRAFQGLLVLGATAALFLAFRNAMPPKILGERDNSTEYPNASPTPSGTVSASATPTVTGPDAEVPGYVFQSTRQGLPTITSILNLQFSTNTPTPIQSAATDPPLILPPTQVPYSVAPMRTGSGTTAAITDPPAAADS
jgi:hypothetical protein